MSYFPDEDYANLKQQYLYKIDILSHWIWKSNISGDDITHWLKNFNSEDIEREQINALHLLSQFMFYELREVRVMLESLYRDHFYKPTLHRLKMANTVDIVSKYQEILSKTRFLGIGNSSESSSLMLYFFRQVNKLPKELFIDRCNLFEYDTMGNITGLKKDANDNMIDYYIFIDDLTASGDQALEEFEKIKISLVKKFNPNAIIYYYTLFSTDVAKKAFDSQQDICMETIFELDETYKAYGDTSRYFPQKQNNTDHTDEKQYSKNVCQKYLNRYTRPYECGYKNGQLLLGFFYNTPDNTLQSFWSDSSSWNPIFKRYDKLYS